MPRLVVVVLLLLLLATGCDTASRTLLERPEGCADELADNPNAPGDECGVADECDAYCCACPGGDVEAQLCIDGFCADEATTCRDAVDNAPGCQ